MDEFTSEDRGAARYARHALSLLRDLLQIVAISGATFVAILGAFHPGFRALVGIGAGAVAIVLTVRSINRRRPTRPPDAP